MKYYSPKFYYKYIKTHDVVYYYYNILFIATLLFIIIIIDIESSLIAHAKFLHEFKAHTDLLIYVSLSISITF